MKTIAFVSLGLLLAGCGTTVIGDTVGAEVGGTGSRGGATSRGGAGGVGGSSQSTCNGTIVDTSGGCLVDDAYCIEMADGRYCTGTISGSGGAASGGAGGTSPTGAAGTDYVPRGGMGGTPSTVAGGAGGVTTQPATKAFCGGRVVTPSGCFLDDAYCFRLSETQYCTGGGSPPCLDGMIEGSTTACSGSYWCWQKGMSGTCRLPLRTSAECAASGGRVIADPGDGSSQRTGCPTQLVNLGPVDASAGDEGGICCGIGEAPFTNGVPNIDALSRCGGRMVSTKAACDSPGFCYLLFNGQYCTGTENWRCPASLLQVPSSACPQNASWCWPHDAVSACALPTRTPEDCNFSQGVVVDDPGDGSLMRSGCPNDLVLLGTVSPAGSAGALCCSRT